MLEAAFIEQVLDTSNGWHDPRTTLRLLALYAGVFVFGDTLTRTAVRPLRDTGIPRRLRRGRIAVIRTVGRLRPRRLLHNHLPIQTRPSQPMRPGSWSWREILLVLVPAVGIALIELGVLWAGLPWLAVQASLPVWMALLTAVVLGTTGSARRPMTGQLAAGALVAGVWLAASPELALAVPVLAIGSGTMILVLYKVLTDLFDVMQGLDILPRLQP